MAYAAKVADIALYYRNLRDGHRAKKSRGTVVMSCDNNNLAFGRQGLFRRLMTTLEARCVIE